MVVKENTWLSKLIQVLKLWLNLLYIDNRSERKFVDDFVALVRGGASESITTLVAKSLPTPELMQQWGDAVQYNPEIIQMKVV